MLEFKTGDILAEEAEALVNTVNCVGVMGRGIALQFKKMFPENFKAYAAACKHNEVQPGRLFVYETGFVTNPRLIVNFPDEASLAGQEPNRGHRSRAQGAGGVDSGSGHRVDRDSAARRRPGWT
jgi:hypothetical protein